ncbi:GLPGLI family protein [Portibacter marinus]|uniref:GLPGLI family protein n=1 Tax=Portibacter marinus TaxID=2898660 RepID=UPI001F480964|nr:GLPGLI family protein [Portibacter marinus]
MKKLIFLGIIAVMFSNGLIGQKTSGTIEYERTQDWVKIMSHMPFMSQEEKDRQRLTWGKRSSWGQPYILYFNEDESLYTYKEEISEYGYSWKKDDFVLIRDYEDQTMYDKVDFLGRTYIMKQDAPRIKWKILNEIKEVAGYLCMKAETIDTVKDIKIHAWFTSDIPVYGGPEGFYGLPGMILGLDYNDGDVVVEAKKIEFSEERVELPIPKRMKGRKLTVAEKNERAKEYIAESIEGRKNPYWQMRY